MSDQIKIIFLGLISASILLAAFVTKTLVFFQFLLFIPFFYVVIRGQINKNKSEAKLSKYIKKLNNVLVNQSRNVLFYEGKVEEGAKALTKEVIDTMEVDRCSIWLYNSDKSSIICQQLYIKSEDNWYQNIELFRKDFTPYFDHLLEDPIIISVNAEEHRATKCFADSYLKPLGIKSMLDVPIIHRGQVIGVICIESFNTKDWNKSEVDFAQMLSSLYTFAYSIKESNMELKRKEIEISNRMNAINRSNAVIEFDLDGNIRFANDSFLNLLGYKQDEVVGKHHSLFAEDGVKNTKEYKEFWKSLREGKFFRGEIIRRKKDGTLIYLQATYNPILGNDGKPYRVMKIATDVTEIFNQRMVIEKKNTYLEHAAKILRHDMHSGINTYIPRGVSSLKRRLNKEIIEKLKLDAPLRMITDGLEHTQKVYKGVYEFTNLVKKDSVLSKESYNLKDLLDSYLSKTAYSSQVKIDDLPTVDVNGPLFCTALDNLIRNGLKYNDSDSKIVSISMCDEFILCVQDNGRGMSNEEFLELSKPYTRKEGQAEQGTGLGLNICVAILKEHGFSVSSEKNKIGTRILIKMR
jgi:PAS domain S-box-containing protein